MPFCDSCSFSVSLVRTHCDTKLSGHFPLRTSCLSVAIKAPFFQEQQFVQKVVKDSTVGLEH